MFLGSDGMALAPFTTRIAYLEEGDMAVLTRAGVSFRDETGGEVQRPVQKIASSALLADKGNHRHFML
jgi:glucosamine--fructose-6-phosphate aminotransferase (isomerizing)